MPAYEWTLGQQNRVSFVMVDSAGAELTGLTLAVEVSKDGGAFVAGGGSWGEIGSGWYWYLSTAGESDTLGPMAIRITAATAIQQNLEYAVYGRQSSAAERDYLVTNSVTLLPEQSVEVTVSIDAGKTLIMWAGMTRADGYAVDANGFKPFLQAGTYYFWKYKPGVVADNIPDVEVFT